MRTNTMSYAMALAAGALGVAGAVAIATASPSWAAPVAPDTTAVRTAASNQLIDVQYHRRGYYGRGYGRSSQRQNEQGNEASLQETGPRE